MPDGMDISWDEEDDVVSSEELEEHLKRSHPPNENDNQVLKGISFLLFWTGSSILAGVLGSRLFVGFWTAAVGGIGIALLTGAIIGAIGSWLFPRKE